ncbi:ATP-binding protein [Pseudonocardia sp. DLS-67]
MPPSARPWQSTTHRWDQAVDEQHVEEIRSSLGVFAAGGVTHLVLEVVAYAADEAAAQGVAGRCAVQLHADGCVLVSDNGRGTDTRVDPSGRPLRKPIMGTKDLRFFDSPDPPGLPDGRPRRGISVVAAASEWLVHTNRRRDGAWTQEYRHGRPAVELAAVPPNGTTGTTVHFRPDDSVGTAADADTSEIAALTLAWRPHLAVRVEDLR